MKCNEKCKYFSKLANTATCGIGICSFSEIYQEVKVGVECPLTKKTLKCRDCWRCKNDMGCMTCEPDDDAIDKKGKICIGFIPDKEEEMKEYFINLYLKDYPILEYINDFKKELKEIIKKIQRKEKK